MAHTLNPLHRARRARSFSGGPGRLVIYGAGGAGRAFLRATRRPGDAGPVAAFCDSDPAKWGTRVDDVPVLPPQDLSRFDPAETRVVVASTYWQSILETLDRTGWPRHAVIEVPGWTAMTSPAETSRGEPCLRFLSTLPRSGTLWLRQMVESVMGRRAMPGRFEDPRVLGDTLTSAEARSRLFCDHFRFSRHGPLLGPEPPTERRIVLLLRHPLDAVISAFHYKARLKWLPQPGLDAIQNMRVWIRKPGVWRSFLQDRVIDWLRSGRVFPCRYEDLAADPAGMLGKVLDHLRISHAPEAVSWSVRISSFESLTGNRAPGVADNASHYRRGLSGEWREVFRREDLLVARREIGDYLEEMGYPAVAAGKSRRAVPG